MLVGGENILALNYVYAGSSQRWNKQEEWGATGWMEPVEVISVQSVRPRGRTGRLSFFKSMDQLKKMGSGSDALRGPVGPCGIFLFSETSS